MHIKRIMFTLFVVASLSFPGRSDASAVRCDSCKTDSDFMLAAEGMGPGQHYVYNLDENTIQRWTIHPRTAPGEQPWSTGSSAPIRNPTPNDVPPAARTELAKAHTLYVINGNTLRPIFNVPIAHLGLSHINDRTIYDAVYDQNLKGQIESAAADPALIDQFVSDDAVALFADLANLATSALGLRDQAAMIFRIVDSDGSYVDVVVRMEDSVGDLRPETARTASGQVIPANSQTAVGTWTYSPADNLARMAAHMERLGVTVEYRGGGSGGGSSGGGGIVTGIVCTPSSCVVEQNPL